LRLFSGVYGRAARVRRAWYRRHPDRVRRLARPVISVGNLVVGGSGKTPVVAAIARLLLAAGEYPAVLSRGYGRRRAADGVVVVSDGHSTQVSAEQSGDEPQMLAQALAGVPVLVSPDRHLAGCLAERRFGCTVHILDDGFQHMQLARDINLLLISRADLDEALLPAGRLREPLDAARAADALLVPGDEDDVDAIVAKVGMTPAFRVLSRQGEPRFILEPHARPIARRRVVAVAGIAHPARFFHALRAGGWDVARQIVFRDHHWFSRRDLASIERAALDERADLIVTTEKDAVRLTTEDVAQSPAPWAAIPLEVSIEPASFLSWMQERLKMGSGVIFRGHSMN
jgi:tetraacyldisaccharide 4'-kinase